MREMMEMKSQVADGINVFVNSQISYNSVSPVLSLWLMFRVALPTSMCSCQCLSANRLEITDYTIKSSFVLQGIDHC